VGSRFSTPKRRYPGGPQPSLQVSIASRRLAYKSSSSVAAHGPFALCARPAASHRCMTLTLAARWHPGETGSTPDGSAIPPAPLLGKIGQLTEFRRKEVQWRGKHSSAPSRT